MSRAKKEPKDWTDKALEQWEKDIFGCDRVDTPNQAGAFPDKVEGLQKRLDLAKYGRWQDRWTEWVKQKMCNTTERPSEPDLEKEWLQKTITGSIEAIMPTLSLKALQQKRPCFSKARFLGEMTGHEFALWHEDSPGLLAGCERMPQGLREFFVSVIECQRKQRLAAVRKIIATASKQSLKDATLFFRGFSLAVQRGSMSEVGNPVNASTATMIYNILVVFSDFVPHLGSVRELHEWLQAALGANLVGSEERVEKICQRIGLRFAPPGRPPQT